MYSRTDGSVFFVRRRPPPLVPAVEKFEEEAGEEMSSVSNIFLRSVGVSYEHSEH